MVSCQAGLYSGWSLFRVVSHKCGLFSGWSPVGGSFQGGLLFGWSLVRFSPLLGGLLLDLSLFCMVSCLGGLLSGGLFLVWSLFNVFCWGASCQNGSPVWVVSCQSGFFGVVSFQVGLFSG